MQQRYFTERYRFVPPYAGTFWCRMARLALPYQLCYRMKVRRLRFQGLKHVQSSMGQGAGILLAANHNRWADAPVLGAMGLRLGQYFHYLGSYHLFRQKKLAGWWLNRLGAFSVLREGIDRAGLQACVEILSEARRPLVVFPEGTWFRQNDRLGPLQPGVATIARMAACRSSRPVVVHPVSIKYWALDDINKPLRKRLSVLELRMGSRTSRTQPLRLRIENLASCIVGKWESKALGNSQSGPLDRRIEFVINHIISDVGGRPLENGLPSAFDRIWDIRKTLVSQLGMSEPDAENSVRVKHQLDDLLLAENLIGLSSDYLDEHPSPERFVETVERLDETIRDGKKAPPVRLGAVVRIRPALTVPALHLRNGEGRRAEAGLMRDLADSLQGALDQMREEGPPTDWRVNSGRFRQSL